MTGGIIDGHSAHSTTWWWEAAGAFYFGGSLFYNSTDFVYTPGRTGLNRNTCKINVCLIEDANDCDRQCPDKDREFLRVTNSKAFLSAGSGFNR